ncbi:general transcription factor iih [Stylonychia lemnae]|uniref:General transcription factor iih n=1 Tax=Stylonychia lemnae TaxID=5949 RepID=A0A077ZW78_STYLE|nr:general transcription factor iih [Stylonychia lemnae]|eukprot:CDW73831.1 general transcription factor iih [Stylonychia lemnae]
MNDLLNLIIDFNMEFMEKHLNFSKFIQDVSMFLGCYQLQSSLNNFRIYISFPHDSYLLFPIHELGDERLIKKFAFADLKHVLLDRLVKLLGGENNIIMQNFNNPAGTVKRQCSLSTAMMKSICFTKQWIEQVSIKQVEQFSARIMVIKFQSEDPSQYSSLVNAIFAAQKLKITIDSLTISIDPMESQNHSSNNHLNGNGQQIQNHNQQQHSQYQQNTQISTQSQMNTSQHEHPMQAQHQPARQQIQLEASLLQQAANLTSGAAINLKTHRIESDLFPTLLEVFSSNRATRDKLKIPLIEMVDYQSMNSTCICCNKNINLGYSCSYCLSLYCPEQSTNRDFCQICNKKLKKVWSY